MLKEQLYRSAEHLCTGGTLVYSLNQEMNGSSSGEQQFWLLREIGAPAKCHGEPVEPWHAGKGLLRDV